MLLLRFLTWILRILLFAFVLIFALKNSDLVPLKFFFGQVWKVPMVLLLLGFFAAGILLGVLAMLDTLFRERRLVATLQHDLQQYRANAPFTKPGQES